VRDRASDVVAVAEELSRLGAGADAGGRACDDDRPRRQRRPLREPRDEPAAVGQTVRSATRVLVSTFHCARAEGGGRDRPYLGMLKMSSEAEPSCLTTSLTVVLSLTSAMVGTCRAATSTGPSGQKPSKAATDDPRPISARPSRTAAGQAPVGRTLGKAPLRGRELHLASRELLGCAPSAPRAI
jgi:hypothetical protein